MNYVLTVPCAALLAAALLSCQASSPQQAQNDDLPASTPAALDVRSQMSMAMEDIHEREGIEPRDMTLLQGGVVTWRSAALGCPEPGQSYADVLTRGVLLIIGAQGKVFHYHGERGKPVFLCPNERRQMPVSGGGLD